MPMTRVQRKSRAARVLTVNMVECRASDSSCRAVRPARPASRPPATARAGALGAISFSERRLISAASPAHKKYMQSSVRSTLDPRHAGSASHSTGWATGDMPCET